jgi:hypothetical protein
VICETCTRKDYCFEVVKNCKHYKPTLSTLREGFSVVESERGKYGKNNFIFSKKDKDVNYYSVKRCDLF